MLLERLTRALLKWWWLIVASVLASSIPTFLGTRALPPTYTSRTTLMVGQTPSPDPNAADFSTGQELTQSYADLAKREPVLRATLETLGLEWNLATLNGMVGSRAILGTSLLEISVTDTEPERARVLVDEIANQLILQGPAGTDPQKEAERQLVLRQVQELRTRIKKSQQEIRDLDDVIAKASSAGQIQDARSQQTAIQTQLSDWQATYAQLVSTLQQGASTSLSVVEPAMTPQPSSPRTLLYVAMAAEIGLALAVGVALLLEVIDDSFKTSDDVRRVLNLTSWGNIPHIEGHDHSDRLVMLQSPRSPTAEAFRRLRVNLQSSVQARPLRTLLLTSPSPEEGKSLIAANLAVTLAQSGKRVILVGADLRRPTQHQIFELDNQAGLSTVLTDDHVSLDDVLQTAPTENLGVLTSGPLPEAPNELLGTKRMSELIEHLQQRADVVIFDSPPVMVVGDAAILVPHMDGTLLVIDSGRTRPATARRSKEALELAKAHLAGVVLNQLSARIGGYYDYYAEDGQRHWRAQRPASPTRQITPGAETASPSLAAGILSAARLYIARLKQIEWPALRSLPASHRIPRPSSEKKPLTPAKETGPEMITPAVGQAVPATAGGYPRVGAPTSTTRLQGTRPSTVSPGARLTGPHIGGMVRQNRFSLALVASTGVVLMAALTSSLLVRQAYKGQTAPIPANITVPTATMAAKETDVAQRQTDEARARSAAATGTAALGATATQVALNASAAQLAVGFLNCDTMDFEILESPVDMTSATSGAANVEFTWRVRNKASLSYCKWGQAGQETRLVRAVEVGGRLGTSVPVTLTWIDDDEYALSLTARLGIGQYSLAWRLLLPKTNSPGGPELLATAVVLASTPTRAPTLVPPTLPLPTPTSTPCPQIVYECECKEKCSGRDCTTVCKECTKQECGK